MRPAGNRRFGGEASGLAALCLLLAIIPLGGVACGSQQTELAAATEVVDSWIAAWNAHDPEAIAAHFTENAVYQDINERWTGREGILEHANYFSGIIQEVRRVDQGRAAHDGAFVFVISFDFDFGSAEGAGTDLGEVEITVSGGLIARVEWLSRKQTD